VHRQEAQRGVGLFAAGRDARHVGGLARQGEPWKGIFIIAKGGILDK
jgi:hypothetical protein